MKNFIVVYVYVLCMYNIYVYVYVSVILVLLDGWMFVICLNIFSYNLWIVDGRNCLRCSWEYYFIILCLYVCVVLEFCLNFKEYL